MKTFNRFNITVVASAGFYWAALAFSTGAVASPLSTDDSTHIEGIAAANSAPQAVDAALVAAALGTVPAGNPVAAADPALPRAGKGVSTGPPAGLAGPAYLPGPAVLAGPPVPVADLPGPAFPAGPPVPVAALPPVLVPGAAGAGAASLLSGFEGAGGLPAAASRGK